MATMLALFGAALAERTLGAERPSTVLSVDNLGFLYQAQRRYGEEAPNIENAGALAHTTAYDTARRLGAPMCVPCGLISDRDRINFL